MKLTRNYSLKKPEGSDVVNIEDFNYNADMIDNKLKEIEGISGTNKSNISSLQTKVNNAQLHKLTSDNGYCINISGQDVYNISSNGFYMGDRLINAPTTNWLYIESLVHNDSYQVLTAIDLHDSSKRWTAHKTGGTWSEWREL